MSVETKLRQDYWRVRKMRALTTDDPPVTIYLHAWGIWPPGWDLDGQPLLLRMTHRQAISAAASRADFAAQPPVAQEDWEP